MNSVPVVAFSPAENKLVLFDTTWTQTFQATDADGDTIESWFLEYDGAASFQIPSLALSGTGSTATVTWTSPPKPTLFKTTDTLYKTCDIKIFALDSKGALGSLTFHLRPRRDYEMTYDPATTTKLFFTQGTERTIKVIFT